MTQNSCSSERKLSHLGNVYKMLTRVIGHKGVAIRELCTKYLNCTKIKVFIASSYQHSDLLVFKILAMKYFNCILLIT